VGIACHVRRSETVGRRDGQRGTHCNYYALPPSRGWLAWLKPEGMETLADFELAWTTLDRPAKVFRSPRNPDGKREHPTQKPLDLMQWCLRFFPAARSVLDPFSGSGTSLVAAKNLGLTAVGIEREERYCEVTARRLSQGVLDLGGAA
jgi:site-specific DNA-methyltransferase (adenine-specific)